MSEAEKRLTKARVRLISNYPFFGRLSLLLKFKSTKRLPMPTAGVGPKADTLYYNKGFINNLEEEHVLSIIGHEVLHLSLGHIWRREDRQRCRWNIAADYAVNLVLRRNGFSLPPGALLDSQFEDMSVEEIYEKLPEMKVCKFVKSGGMRGKSKEDGEQMGGGGSAEGEGGSSEKESREGGEGGGKNGDEEKEKDEDGGGKGGEGGGKKDEEDRSDKGGSGEDEDDSQCPCSKSHRYWGRAEKKEQEAKKRGKSMAAKWRAAVRDAHERLRGDTPAGLERLIEEIQPREDWKKLLAMYVSTSTTDFDFMRRDRRSLNSRFYFPDLSSEDSLEDVVVAIDTSGSISPTELSKFVSETKSILDVFPKVRGWLVDCDVEIGEWRKLEKFKPDIKFYGGGGTDFNPVFDEIERRKITPKVVIFFTDGCGFYPEHPPTYPVLWLLVQSYDVPFGRPIILKGGLDGKGY